MRELFPNNLTRRVIPSVDDHTGQPLPMNSSIDQASDHSQKKKHTTESTEPPSFQARDRRSPYEITGQPSQRNLFPDFYGLDDFFPISHHSPISDLTLMTISPFIFFPTLALTAPPPLSQNQANLLADADSTQQNRRNQSNTKPSMKL